jgi:hypothetical protein
VKANTKSETKNKVESVKDIHFSKIDLTFLNSEKNKFEKEELLLTTNENTDDLLVASNEIEPINFTFENPIEKAVRNFENKAENPDPQEVKNDTVKQPVSSSAVASLISGVAGVGALTYLFIDLAATSDVFGLFPITFFSFANIFSALAIVFGTVGILLSKRKKAGGKNISIAGVFLGGLLFLTGLLVLIIA